jgi:hypothetical protein
MEVKNLNDQETKNHVRKFCSLIERNKDHQAYSDYKEGINKGLEIARGTFEENCDVFFLLGSSRDQSIEIEELQNKFNSLIDTIVLTKKPNCSEDRMEGIYSGFEKSKEIFGEFIKESL